MCFGCDRGPRTGTVSGMVTYKEKPVGEGTVSFRNETKGIVAAIKLETDGGYELRFAGGKEIPVGSYVVIVNPPEPHVPIASELSQTSPRVEIRPVSNIPLKYRTVATSNLTAEVVEGANRFNFTLHD